MSKEHVPLEVKERTEAIGVPQVSTLAYIKRYHALEELLWMLLAFVVIFVSYILIKPLNGIYGSIDGAVARCYGAILLLAIAIVFYVEFLRKKLSTEKKLFFIMLLAFVIHLTYMLYTVKETRQYDTWSSNGDGHYDYARIIFETWALPTTKVSVNDVYQFYHPPLNAFIQAVFMKVFSFLCWDNSLSATTEDLFGSTQILACFYMVISSLFLIKTLKLAGLSDRALVWAAIFAALFPRLNQLSGQLNNDSLCIMLTIVSLYYAFKWYLYGKHMRDIVLMALFLGLSMMAKLSAVIICFGMAVVFVIELVNSIRRKDGSLRIGSLLWQYLIFIFICAPIGLWFQVYYHVVYGLPYGFVFRNLNSALFTGTQSWVYTHVKSYYWVSYNSDNSGLMYTNVMFNFVMKYIFPFYPPDIMAGGPIFASSFNDYNIMTYALKTSIFGEFTFNGGTVFALIAVVSAYVVWFSLLTIVTYLLIKRKSLGKAGMFSLYLVIGIIACFIYLNIDMPYGCSPDFRYIMPIVLPLAVLLGKASDLLKSSKSKFSYMAWRTLSFALLSFISASCFFYMLTD